MISLTEPKKQRYLRNTIIEKIGEKGQEKLLASKVLVIGAGGLGSAAILYLVAAGIGNIGVVDDDVVELSNLQRQVIHNEKNLGQKKILSTQEKILALNSDINLKIYDFRASLETLANIESQYDFVLDCSDNFQTRFVINEFCHKYRKTLISAAVKEFSAQISVFKSFEEGCPCYSCFNQNLEKSVITPLSEKGILGSVAGCAGTMQATQAVKEILGIGESLSGKILFCDFLENNFRKVSLSKNPSCKICSVN